ncbi:MAG: LTA synthase family protein [Bacillota bacterium]|nr:LTA synthase family protein [Bacillota bacterium]
MMLVFGGIILLNELFFRASINRTLFWLVTQPVPFVLNLLLMAGVAGVAALLTSSLYASTLAVGMPALLLGAVNGIKFVVRTAPLSRGDLTLWRELWTMMPVLVQLHYTRHLLIGAVLAVGGVIWLKRWMPPENAGRPRWISFSLIVTALLLLGAAQIILNPEEDMWENGFLYTFIMPARVQTPYDAEAMMTAAEKVGQILVAETEEAPAEVEPHVIVIMSESFWDVSKLDVSFTHNPIPVFESLREESLHGEIYVPVFSGGTGNTEYEVLTGMSLLNYKNNWHIVYNQGITDPIPSLASIFRKQGYQSIGIHPYTDWFYNRVSVYQNLGFDVFESIDSMEDPELVGEYVSDDFLTDRLIRLLETSTQPVFATVITMQNHGPYSNERYAEEDFQIKVEESLSPAAATLLNTYAQGIHLSDRALGRLVDYLREQAEPTLLLFFGDHLPMLGEDHLVFRETGYIGSESNHELMKDLRMMTVPYIFWSNYGTPTGEQPVMNASFLAPQLLQLARKEMPQYLKVVASIREEMPLLMRDHGINASGRRVSAETSEYQLARAKYHQANLLFLQQTPEGDTGKWVIAENDSYRQSVQELVIHEIKHENMTTEISGGRFDPRLTLLVDQIPVDFWCLDENTLLIESRLEPGSVMVLQRMTTSGNVMAESPPFRVP